MKNVKVLFWVITPFLVGGCANQPVEQIITIKKQELPERVSHLIEFDFDSFLLPPNAESVIKPHVQYLIQNPKARVLLQGCASVEGKDVFNYNLAIKRAESVKELFIKLGIAERQIIISSIGESFSNNYPSRSVTITY